MKKTVKKKLDALNLSLRDLLTDLEGYSEDTLNKAPKEGAWSVFQIMNHLILAERKSIQYVQKKLSFDPKLKSAGITSKMSSLLVNTYLSSPMKVKAPEMISGDNLPSHSTFWEVTKAWKTDREALQKYLNELPEELFKKEIYKHPLGGRLSLEQMLSFFQKHYARHHKQIYRTLDQLDAVKIK